MFEHYLFKVAMVFTVAKRFTVELIHVTYRRAMNVRLVVHAGLYIIVTYAVKVANTETKLTQKYNGPPKN